MFDHFARRDGRQRHARTQRASLTCDPKKVEGSRVRQHVDPIGGVSSPPVEHRGTKSGDDPKTRTAYKES